MTPGKRPASVIPKKKRAAKIPAELLHAAMAAITVPQLIITIGIHLLGPINFKIKLEGTSNKTYQYVSLVFTA